MGRVALYAGAAMIVVIACAYAAIMLTDDNRATIVYESDFDNMGPYTVASNVVADFTFEREGFAFSG